MLVGFERENQCARCSSTLNSGILFGKLIPSVSDVLAYSGSFGGCGFVGQSRPSCHLKRPFAGALSYSSVISDSVCDCLGEVDRLRVVLQRTNLNLVCAVDYLDVHKALVPRIVDFIVWCRNNVLDSLRSSSAFFELERPLARIADLHPDCFRALEIQDLFVFPDPAVALCAPEAVSSLSSGLVECSNLTSCDVDGFVPSGNDELFGYTVRGVPVVSTGDSSALGHLVVPLVGPLCMDSVNFLPQERESLDLCKLLSVTHKRVNELEACLRSSEEDKDQLQLTIADLEKQMREKDLELADALDELRAHRAELETSLNMFLEKSDEFDSLRAENLSLQDMANDAVQRQRAAIVDAESTHDCLMKTELEIVSLKDRLISLDKEVRSLKGVISYRDQELTDASTLRGELEMTISCLQSEGREKDATIAGLHFELTTASEKFDRSVDVDIVGERAAPVVDRVSAGVFDVVDSDVMGAVVSKGIFVESSDLESRLADALCRIDVLEKEKCQLESQLSSVCPSSMVDVVNSYVCGVPSVVRSVVTEPIVACSDVVCGGVEKVPESELSDLQSRLSSAEVEVSLLRDCLSERG
ncbi:hypothetical protein X801_08663, partial [Opisthorchis viverrini]